MFRLLNDTEGLAMREWARDNWIHGMNVNPLWHPIVRDEIDQMEHEFMLATINEESDMERARR